MLIEGPKTMRYSIIVCTHNPDDRIFSRCLNAIEVLRKENIWFEVLLVDNNSFEPLSDKEYVIAFLNKVAESKLVHIAQQGLAMARAGGIREAKGEFLVFFDDDNEPSVEYIIELDKLNKLFPHVGVWGPGNITVDFIDGVNPSDENSYRQIFQERHSSFIEYAMIREWQSCYPFGTGLCIKKKLAAKYIERVVSGELTLIGRNGEKMSSGDDTQMVLQAITMGYAAGISPQMSVLHIIPAKKLDFNYLKRLAFGTSSCSFLFPLEVLPEYKSKIEQLRPINSSKLYTKVLRQYIKLRLKPDNLKTLDFIEYVGWLYSYYIATEQEIPDVIKWVIKKMNVS